MILRGLILGLPTLAGQGAAAPELLVAPTIVGLPPVYNSELTGVHGVYDIDPEAYEYKWQRDTGTIGDIAGATSGAYTPVVGDIGYPLRFGERAQANGVWSDWNYSDATVPTVPATPSITAPADAATATSLTPAFTWTDIGGTAVYAVRLYRDSGLTDEVALDNASGISGGNYTADPTTGTVLPIRDVAYYWTLTVTVNGYSATTPARSLYVNIAAAVAAATASYLVDADNLATLFQDSAGTTPVASDNDPVGKVVDALGGADVLTQATTDDRPLYKPNILNTTHNALLYGGAADMDFSNLAFLRNKPSMGMFRLIKYNTLGANRDPFRSNNAAGGVRLLLRTTATPAYAMFSSRLDDTSNSSLLGGTPQTTNWVVQANLLDWVNRDAIIRINGASVASELNFGGAGGNWADTDAVTATEGSKGDGTEFMDAYVAFMLFVTPQPAADYVAAIEAYLASRRDDAPYSPPGAADWYVATDGDDGGEGTELDPFLTVQHAIDTAAPGDTVSVAAGTYAERVVHNKLVHLVGVGLPKLIAPAGAEAQSFYATGSGVEGEKNSITGFEIDGTNRYRVFDGNCSYYKIHQCVIHDGYGQIAGQRGQGVTWTKSPTNTDIEISECEIYNIGNSVDATQALYCHGIYPDNPNVWVHDCVFHDISGYATHGYGSTSNNGTLLIENCFAYPGDSTTMRGYGCFHGTITLRNSIARDLVYAVDFGYGANLVLEVDFCTLLADKASKIAVHSATLPNGASAVFRNNVVQGKNGFAINQLTETTATIEIAANNLVDAGTLEITYGGDYAEGITTDSLVAGLKTEFTPVTDDGADSIVPTTGNPAIGAGTTIVGVTEDYAGVTRGEPPDIGAFEAA